MLGYSSQELEGLKVEVLLPEAIRHTHVAQRDDYMNTPKQRVMNQNRRFTALRKDGTEFPVAVSLNPTEIDDEAFVCASIQDLTQVEEQAFSLEQSQKLEALGEMVSGIAHNFNNVLAGITGQAYLLTRSKALAEDELARVESITSLSNQAADIIKQLLIYARNENVEFEDFDLGQAIQETVDIAKIAAPEKISIQVNKSKTDLVVHGKKNQIEQTVLNLINNAIQAIGESEGSINISTVNCVGASCKLKQCSLNRDDARGFVCIKVRDTGKGISKKNIERIFDPFFSTKPQGHGTGLGLSTSYGIVKKHGGEISVSSIEGEGAMFQLFLPVAEDGGEPESEAAIAAPFITSKGETILIVDDEASIRNVLTEAINGFGYSTLTTSNGQEALELFEQQKDNIDLVVTDMAMPKLNGQELIEKIRNIEPEMPCIFVTGYQDSSTDEAILLDKTQVILKPFDYVQLSHRIKDALR